MAYKSYNHTNISGSANTKFFRDNFTKDAINKIPINNTDTMKIGVGTSETGIGIVIWNDEQIEIPSTDHLEDTWYWHAWINKDKDLESLGESCTDFMNNTLNEASAYYSHLTLSDRTNGSAVLTLWFRRIAKPQGQAVQLSSDDDQITTLP